MKKSEVRGWEIATYTDEGKSNRPAATSVFSFPAKFYVEKDDCVRPYFCEADCDLFCWKLKWNKADSERKTISLTGEVLVEFIRLADEDSPQEFARKVESFAQKWGNLDLCKEHHMPASHNYNCEPSIPHKKVVLRPAGVSNVTKRNEIYSESLSGWREYAIFAKSLLNIAANLQEGKLGEDKDWNNLHSYGHLGWSHTKKRKEESYQERLFQFEQKLIADGVNHWLALGNLRPEIKWNDTEIIINFKSASAYGSLFAYLALQLMLIIGKQDGLAICSTCGTPYVPKRKPDNKKRRFCLQCRKSGKPQTLASADYRNRKKEKAV